MCGSLVSSALGQPPQIPRGPASLTPRAGLLWLRASPPLALVGRDRFVAISEFFVGNYATLFGHVFRHSKIEHCGQMFVNKSRVHLTHRLGMGLRYKTVTVCAVSLHRAKNEFC